MIKHFFKETKPAIQYIHHHKIIRKSFKELYDDIYKMIVLFQTKGLKPKDKVGLFVMPYTYAFYVVMYASFLYQLNLVVFDSYKKKHIKELMALEKVGYCVVDSKTKMISSFILPKCKRINVSSFTHYNANYHLNLENSTDSIILTTFTSGTTGGPKTIHRTLDFLLKQANEIQNEIDLQVVSFIFGGLPIYNVLSIYLLKTTCISRRIKSIQKFEPDCVLTNIQKICLEKRSYPSVKNLMLGGAILYSNEVKKIKEVFPNATVTYVYGASEGAIIYKTNLEEYQKQLFTFDTPAKEIKVFINEPDLYGIGEIVITGEKVNTKDHKHYTGDLGKLTDGRLTLVGRKKYSSIENGFYNYAFDEQIRRENHCFAFSFYYKHQIYVVYTGKLKQKKEGIKYIKRKLPMDLKHKTKLDYKVCINQIIKKHL
ncbi:MAG: AMP-binding protein [Roseburia sp.]|nr:AMP-binding protein [Anaeroplasma bactoclasticum]MCM1195550.1 AMP-binding protein [Roseburia sp.]MCM1555965.1 AMP-binding protein [Anaeroplasma bactoclasticum]